MKPAARIALRLFLPVLIAVYLVAANFNPPLDSNATVIAAGAQAQAFTKGQFGPLIGLPVVPIHTSVLHDGQVIFWGRDKLVAAPGESIPCCFSSIIGPGGQPGWKVGDNVGFTTAYVWNPKTNALINVNYTGTELFCSGHSLLPDGRLFVTGGHGAYCRDAIGERDTNVFDPITRTWAEGINSSPDMSKGRWYPTNLTMADGRTLILSGYRDNTSNPNSCPNTFTVNETTELYNPQTNSLHLLSPNNPVFPVYPHAFLAPDGRAFIAGPENSYLWNTSGGIDGNGGLGSYVNLGPLSILEGNVFKLTPHTDGSAVLYDSNGKVLILGGRDNANAPLRVAQVIDLTVNNPATGQPRWRQVASMNHARNFPNSTVLPNGKVLVAGGTSCSGVWSFSCDPPGARTPEMWDPQTETWTLMASHQIKRGYHATAILLPDARVFLGGGGLPGAQDQGASPVENRIYGEFNAEIYSPPYLFNPDGTLAQRPVITSAPQSVGYNEKFSISTPSPSSISRAVLVRLPSVTHGVNMDQRMVVLDFNVGGATTLDLGAPATAIQCPPGFYMLFIFNSSGVPSEAKIIRVSGNAVNVAVGKASFQSSTAFGGAPSRAVDGNTNGLWSGGSVTHTDFNNQAWWQVDVGNFQWIEDIKLWNRTDCCGERLSNFYVFVSDKPFTSTSLSATLSQPGVSAYHIPGQAGSSTLISIGRRGRYVRVQLAGANYLSLAEVQILARTP